MMSFLSVVLLAVVFMLVGARSSSAASGTKKHILVSFFSRAGENYGVGVIPVGNTAVIGRYIADALDADIFEIVMEKPYSDKYKECTAQAKADLQDNARPSFIGDVNEMDQYDTIFLGYPNYWGTYPKVVDTFLERYAFSGKKIAPFCTHEGSGFGSSLADLAKKCPHSTLLKGYDCHGTAVGSAEKDVRRWLKGLGILS